MNIYCFALILLSALYTDAQRTRNNNCENTAKIFIGKALNCPEMVKSDCDLVQGFNSLIIIQPGWELDVFMKCMTEMGGMKVSLETSDGDRATLATKYCAGGRAGVIGFEKSINH